MTDLTTIFALMASDEMRQSYEASVHLIGVRIIWLASSEDLLSGQTVAQEPLAVIVDLDAMEKPWELELENLKSAFPNSDLVAFSSHDSAQLAVRCIRSGFQDFLLKPVSPEEFAWTASKCRQRHELLERLSDTKTQIVKAIAHISNSTSPSLLHHTLLEGLQHMLISTGAAWIEPLTDGSPGVVCSYPQPLRTEEALTLLPKISLFEGNTQPIFFRTTNAEQRKVYVPFHDPRKGGVLIWGIGGKISKRGVTDIKTLIEHAEVCLLNLQKFQEIKSQTFIDDLTGLYNSRYWKFALSKAIVRSRQKGKPFALLFIDIDHFKTINDTKGHVVGSAFLAAIARTIRNTVRRVDPVFRYGGDEFVVILQDAGTKAAAEAAERIRRSVEKRVFLVKDGRLQATVSIGVAVYPDHTDDKETLLKLADEAMYSAKETRRNTVQVSPFLSP